MMLIEGDVVEKSPNKNGGISMNNGISFTSMADGECLSFMRTRHIYALFSNALDNAVEKLHAEGA